MNRSVEFGEEMQEPLQSAVIHIKWNHFGKLRRFQLSEVEWKFSKLLEKIRMVEPFFSETLCYSDEDGDKIVFSSTAEMDEMLCHFRQLRVSTIKIETVDNPEKSQTCVHGPAPAAKEAQKTVHPNIICDLCDSPVLGIRYKCATCDDYDLCESCEKTGAHKEHAMIRLVTPDPTKLYDLLYSLRRHHRGRHAMMRHGASSFNKDAFVCKMRERTERLQKLHESMERSHPCARMPGVLHQNNVAAARTSGSVPKPNAAPILLRPQREMDDFRPFGYVPPQNNQQQADGGPQMQRPPIVDKFHEKMDYLKNIGAQVQQALLSFGIECEATVEDDNGRVHGRVPLARATAMNAAQNQASNQAPKRKSEDKTAAEESKYPKKTETSHIAAQAVADQTARESLSQAIQTATHETINRASQASLDALNAATGIMGSLGFSEQAGETTNRRGTDVFESVKTSMENLANAMTPLIADLTEKCQIIGEAIPMPPPSQHPFQVPQQNTSPQPNVPEAVSEIRQNNASENQNSVNENSAMDTTDEIIHIEDDVESCHTALEPDSDVEVLREMAHMPELVDSRSQAFVGENDGFIGTPNNSNISRSRGASENGCEAYQVDSDEEWMLVSKSSYKQMCDFFEKQRKTNGRDDNDDDLEEFFVGSSGQQKEVSQAALNRDTSTSSRVETQAELNNNEAPQPEQVPASLVQANQAAANSLNQTSNSAPNSAIYPELVEDSKCTAGLPYYNPVKPHNKRCYVRHRDANVQRVVDQLENMGYDNCNGWLTRLAEMHHGNIEKILDQAIEDPLYLARLAD